jgi:iron-sulfur cluster assembly protein
MPIHLTASAVERITKFLEQRPDAVAVRLGVRRTGCSGYAYVVDLTDTIAADDTVFEQGGVKVVVDASSLGFLDGTEVDFARQGLNANFVFRNPNVTGECGCGESFTVA